MNDATVRPFLRFAKRLTEIHQILVVSMRGLHDLGCSFPLAQAVEAARRTTEGRSKGAEHWLELTRQQATLARREVRRDFPLLHAHAVVAIWSSLETVAEDALVAYVRIDRNVLHNEALKRIRVSIVEYEQLDYEARGRLVAKEVQSTLGADLKRGIGRFQALFELLGAKVKIDDTTRRTFFEMNCLRNAIVHNASVVDSKLANEVPWLRLRVGKPIEISHRMFQRYFKAANDYLTSVVNALAAITSREGKRPKRDLTNRSTRTRAGAARSG